MAQSVLQRSEVTTKVYLLYCQPPDFEHGHVKLSSFKRNL